MTRKRKKNPTRVAGQKIHHIKKKYEADILRLSDMVHNLNVTINRERSDHQLKIKEMLATLDGAKKQNTQLFRYQNEIRSLYQVIESLGKGIAAIAQENT
jgi:hypothetical protein